MIPSENNQLIYFVLKKGKQPICSKQQKFQQTSLSKSIHHSNSSHPHIRTTTTHINSSHSIIYTYSTISSGFLIYAKSKKVQIMHMHIRRYVVRTDAEVCDDGKRLAGRRHLPGHQVPEVEDRGDPHHAEGEELERLRDQGPPGVRHEAQSGEPKGIFVCRLLRGSLFLFSTL